MPFEEIKNLLHRSIGLDAGTVGESSIDRAINHRMRETKNTSPGGYLKFIEKDAEELDELIEEVVVPETWFFRNVTPFEVLREKALELHARISKTNGRGAIKEDCGPLKVLSIPCSTGEEPYSLAITLHEAGLKSNDFEIDAVDVSKRALRKARRAIYGKHSFREQNLDLQNRYFDKLQSGFRLSSTIRDCVSFRKGNVLIDSICPKNEYYHIIFCRNLLIYFDRNTQRLILDKLSAILKEGGLLFVGHAETGQIDKKYFSKIPTSKAFAFQKNKSGEKSPLIAVNDPQPVDKLKGIYDQLVEVTRKDVELSKKINKTTRSNFKVRKHKAASESIFLKVNQLINTGHLLDAVKLCEDYLEGDPENSDAYYYLGLISNLQGGVGGAETLLRKAIYLSPNNHKALALSAVLAEQRGDMAGAESFRRREKKARQRKS